MTNTEKISVEDDFDFVLTFLPPDWDGKARELGALRRCRKFPDAKVLLRVLLLHLAEGCSLRETAVRAKHGGLVAVSDVAIMDRLSQAGEWFHWMTGELMSQWMVSPPEALLAGRWNARIIDGTLVKEPGPTGSYWRIHYSIALPTLRCTELHIAEAYGEGNGESFRHFSVAPNDLFVGDRAYGRSSSIAHIAKAGGAVLTRFGWNSLPLWADNEQRFDLLEHLARLGKTQVGDWPVTVMDGDCTVPGRVCAVRRSRQAAEEARQQARRKSQKNGVEITAQTLEAADYVFVFTTLRKKDLQPSKALEFYRGRWQVELVFKRLKSIIDLGHLHKQDATTALAWLHGKLFVALLIQVMLRYAGSFSPWGYPLRPEEAP